MAHVLGVFIGLAIVFSLIGFAIKAWNPAFDAGTMLSIANHPNATLTGIAHIVSDAGSFALLAPLSIAFILLRRWKRPDDDLSLVVIAAGCALLPSAIKLIVQRERPLFGSVGHLVTFSFPSEHTTQAAGIYLTIAILLSKDLPRGWRETVIAIAVLIALAVAWARVYLSVHYPTDVAAGLLLGWTWSLLLLQYARPQLTQSLGRGVTAANETATS